MSSNINYDRINEIMSHIPKKFYFALLGEYVAVFGINHIVLSSDDSSSFYFDTGTAGWEAALFATCNKLNMDWLFEEWTQMKYYDSDTLDSMIEDELVKILKNDKSNANPYFKYIIKRIMYNKYE